jgi:hypothetical protein
VKAEKKNYAKKAKPLENAELQLKADKYDITIEETIIKYPTKRRRNRNS